IDRIKKIAAADLRIAASSPSSTAAPRAVDRLKEGEIVPFFALTNQDGARLTSESLRGHPYVLTFIFTRCPVPNFCPRISNNFEQLQEAIKSDPKLAGTRLLSVTLDPALDTPAILKAYGEHLQANFATCTFATGDPAQINLVIQSFGVFVQPE